MNIVLQELISVCAPAVAAAVTAWIKGADA